MVVLKDEFVASVDELVSERGGSGMGRVWSVKIAVG